GELGPSSAASSIPDAAESATIAVMPDLVRPSRSRRRTPAVAWSVVSRMGGEYSSRSAITRARCGDPLVDPAIRRAIPCARHAPGARLADAVAGMLSAAFAGASQAGALGEPGPGGQQ